MILFYIWMDSQPYQPNFLQTYPSSMDDQGDDPSNHVMTFHLWGSSNSLVDDSIRLWLFQWILKGVAAKWYIKFPHNTFIYFSPLSMVFLTHFQLPIHYRMGTKIFTLLRQSNSTHKYDHIHEWRRHRMIIKAQIPNQFLADWFVKMLDGITSEVNLNSIMRRELCTKHLSFQVSICLSPTLLLVHVYHIFMDWTSTKS